MRYLTPALFLASLSAVAQTWTQLPDFPGTARDDAASFTIGSQIYVGTGLDAGFQLTNDWWRFDMQTETWGQIAAMPTTPRQYCTGFTIVDTGYVFGGVDANGASDQLWAYHPEQDSWEQMTSIPAEARYACVAVTGFYSNAIVATGMLASGVPTNEAWKYQAYTDTWESIAPVPGPARHRAACFLDGSGMHIVGGADSTFTALDDAWSYPIWFETGQWYPAAPLPEPRFSADGSWGNALAVVGGATGPGPADLHADAWRTDGQDWSSLPAFPGGPRRGAVSASGADIPWASMVYYGTGSDNTQRYHDWWKLEYPVGIAVSEKPVISIAPVPADAELLVITPFQEQWTDWQVRTLDARTVAHGALISDRQLLPTSAIPSGTYLLQLTGMHGTATTRFVVAH